MSGENGRNERDSRCMIVLVEKRVVDGSTKQSAHDLNEYTTMLLMAHATSARPYVKNVKPQFPFKPGVSSTRCAAPCVH